MSDTLETGIVGADQNERSRYHVILLDDDDGVKITLPLPVDTDEAAMNMARVIAKGAAFDLWDNLRLIGHADAMENA